VKSVITYPGLAEQYSAKAGLWGCEVQVAFFGNEAVAVLTGWKTEHPLGHAQPTISFEVVATRLGIRDGEVMVIKEIRGRLSDTGVQEELFVAARAFFKNNNFLTAANL
jgi:hypothetical protein